MLARTGVGRLPVLPTVAMRSCHSGPPPQHGIHLPFLLERRKTACGRLMEREKERGRGEKKGGRGKAPACAF